MSAVFFCFCCNLKTNKAFDSHLFIVSFLLAGAIRKSAPVTMVALLVLLLALALATLGNAKQNNKTLIGAVFYVVSGMSP